MTPLRITVDGTDTARFHDLLSVQCRKAPICKLARAMITNGVDAAHPVEIWRGETKCFNAAPLSWWADRTVSETDNLSARFAKWAPMPSELHKGALQ